MHPKASFLMHTPEFGSAQVWDFQGSQTLSHFLQRRDCLRALAGELGVEEGAVVPTVMQHLFQCLEVGGCSSWGGLRAFNKEGPWQALQKALLC